MILDYQEAIKVLSKRKTELEGELQALDLAISVLVSQNASFDFSKFKPVFKANSRPTKIPKAFNSNLKYPAKVLWLLETGGPQTILEMISTLDLIDDVPDSRKLFNGLTYAASGLFKKGELNAEKVGKAYRYSIKKKGDLATASNT